MNTMHLTDFFYFPENSLVCLDVISSLVTSLEVKTLPQTCLR